MQSPFSGRSWFTIQGIWNSSARIIYVHAVFQTVCFLSGSASQSVAHRTIYFEMQGLCIVGWIFSRIIFAIFISLLWAALRSTFSHKIQYLNKMYTVEHFSERNQISKVLRKKLKSYYRYKYKFEIFPRVFSNIPKQMKEVSKRERVQMVIWGFFSYIYSRCRQKLAQESSVRKNWNIRI